MHLILDTTVLNHVLEMHCFSFFPVKASYTQYPDQLSRGQDLLLLKF